MPQSAKNEAPAAKRRSSVWIVINLMLVAAAAYILYKREHSSAEAPAGNVAPGAVSTPAAVAAPTAMPATVSKPATAVNPAAPVDATPEPPIVLSSVDRKALPRQVMLTKPVDFILLSDGRQVGSIHAVPGVAVDLVDVASDGEIEVQIGEARQTIPAADTDIEKRVRALLKYR